MRFVDRLVRYSRLLTVLVVIVIASLVTTIVRVNHRQPAYTVLPACSLLTKAVAQKAIGNDVKPQTLKPVTTAQTSTTFCAYRSASSSVSLVVRSAKNKQGISLNKQAFSSPPVASKLVPNYGDAAYWTPSFAQLNILKHNTWYILSVGSNTPSQRTLAQTEKYADQIIAKL